MTTRIRASTQLEADSLNRFPTISGLPALSEMVATKGYVDPLFDGSSASGKHTHSGTDLTSPAYYADDADTVDGLHASDIGGGSPSGPAGGDLSGTYPNPEVQNDSHTHSGSNLTSPVYYADDSDKLDGLHATDFVQNGDAAGGDLFGTYPNPEVTNDSHTHSGSNLTSPAYYADDSDKLDGKHYSDIETYVDNKTNAGFKAVKSASDQTIGTGAHTIVVLDSEQWDTGSDFAGNKFTAPTDGKYIFNVQNYWPAANDQKIYTAHIYVNQAAAGVYLWIRQSISGAGGMAVPQCTCTLDLTATDEVEAMAYQDSGGDETLGKAADLTFMDGQRIAD